MSDGVEGVFMPCFGFGVGVFGVRGLRVERARPNSECLGRVVGSSKYDFEVPCLTSWFIHFGCGFWGLGLTIASFI